MSGDLIFPGNVCQALGREVADELGIEVGGLTIKTFPDGERYLRVESDVADKHCIVIQSTSHPQDANLMELITLADTLKDLGASKVTAALPYFGYGRQDKRFKSGEAISSKVVAKHLSLGIDELITVNIHEEQILNFFDIPSHNLDASPLLGDYFKTHELASPIVVAPDEGALEMAKDIAAVAGCPYDYLEKNRLAPGKVEMKPKSLDVSEKDVILVDDMIDSGSTMLEAIGMLGEQGALTILLGCVHPVLTSNVISKLFSAGAVDVVATNTIPSQVSFITVSPLIAEALRGL
jgi:ribose-phosphate pyrophosphokinase